MTELITIKNDDLDIVVKQSGIEIQEGEEIKKSYAPFLESLFAIQKDANKINFESPSELDEKIARDLRLKIVKIRTGAADLKDSRKKIYLLKGNLEQSAYNLIKSTCELAEHTLNNVEKAREIAEAKRKAERKEKRLQQLSEYEFDSTYIDLANMPDEQFDKLIIQLDAEKQAKIEAEKQAELLRIENERKDKLYQERRVLIAEYNQFYTPDLTQLTKDTSDVEFKSLMDFLKSKYEEHQKEQERIRRENEEMQREIEAKEAQLKKEREEAEKKLAEERRIAAEKAEKERIERERIEKERQQKLEAERQEQIRIQKEKDEAARIALEKEREEKERIENELKAKKEAEEKEKARLAEIEKQKQIEAEKAAKAPRKEKLQKWVDSFNIEATNIDDQVVLDIINKFNAFKVWAKEQIEKI